MPDLIHTLQGHDLGFLKIVASGWGIELNSPDAAAALPVLLQSLQDPRLLEELVEVLPVEARDALQALMDSQGQMPWAQFGRRFGEVRIMGAARRDRERPDLKPVSAAEVLWYRALIGKAFLKTGAEPQEYAYIPDELVSRIAPWVHDHSTEPYGRPASPGECATQMMVNDRILDHACTLLAALRMDIPIRQNQPFPWPYSPNTLSDLLFSAGLVDRRRMPVADAARRFLEASRGDALALLVRGWMESPHFNDLRHLPGLKFEGDWANDPIHTRQAVLALLSHVSADTWWSLAAFVGAVRDRQPDFQRPAGDYDSWFIRREDSENFLRGFSSWDEIDGALLRYLITGPLHWLGILDLAAPAAGAAPAAFKISAWAEQLWMGQAPNGLAQEKGKIKASSNGRIQVERLAPRSIRYQVARFCQWEAESEDEYHYRLAPAALEKAQQQGLKAVQFLALLKKAVSSPLPPDIVQAVERWEKYGLQANLEKAILLRVASVEILAALRKTRAARYLGEALNPTTIMIKPGGEEAIRSALADLGYLSDIKPDV